jgi:Outer membrane protein beta-barrel domain
LIIKTIKIMKQIIKLLTIVLLISNISFAQKSAVPIKKTVTSKITKDPTTGKVVKTIITTTTTTTDVVLVPGTTKQVQAKTNPIAIKKPMAKNKVVTAKPKLVAKPKPIIAVKPAERPSAPAPTTVVVKAEPESIFTNPADNSANNMKVEPEAKQAVAPAKAKVLAASKPTETPKKVFKEGNPELIRNYFGVRFGVNSATVANASAFKLIANPTTVNKIGVKAGVFYNLGLTKSFSIQPEVNFSQQGYKIANGIDEDKLLNTAVNIPILLKMAVGSKNVKFFVNGGPYAGILLNSKHTVHVGNINTIEIADLSSNNTNEIKTNRFDYGVQTGAGIQINLGGPKLELEGRYQYGLADPMTYSSAKPSYIGETGRNRMVTGTVGLMFPIGK